MFEHQVNHRERITNHLKRGWRDYIIAEVLDKLSDDYNFFSDDLEKHMQSPLHALLRKLVSWQKTKESYHLVGWVAAKLNMHQHEMDIFQCFGGRNGEVLVLSASLSLLILNASLVVNTSEDLRTWSSILSFSGPWLAISFCFCQRCLQEEDQRLLMITMTGSWGLYMIQWSPGAIFCDLTGEMGRFMFGQFCVKATLPSFWCRAFSWNHQILASDGCCFARTSFLPDDKKKQPFPLLYIDLEVLGMQQAPSQIWMQFLSASPTGTEPLSTLKPEVDNDEIYLEPEPTDRGCWHVDPRG